MRALAWCYGRGTNRGDEAVRAAALHGFLLAFGLILPIGMQNGFILMQGALHRSFRNALPAVLTAALCDTLLIAVAVLGVSAAALHVAWIRYTFGVVGIAFLIYMGVSTWREQDPPQEAATTEAAEADSSPWPARRQMGFSASVSLLNPHALMDTLAVIGGSAAAYTAWREKLAFGAACAAVSWVWFFGLCIAGHLAGRAALQRASFAWLRRISAVMMWGSAVYLAYMVWT
ncbi:MAG: LysE family transporter [Thermoflavifilum sp.]|nr:LysE family transporter [Thermoflavifilum sp.]MCL6513128.1 LysE family transporter [Alicyclobacillus sp.]